MLPGFLGGELLDGDSVVQEPDDVRQGDNTDQVHTINVVGNEEAMNTELRELLCDLTMSVRKRRG